MAGNGVIIDSKHHNDWIVPRRVMCAFFWIGIILLFTGIILLVTSKHKGELYQSWGAIVLGLGFCLLLICLILCLHAYCVITITDDEVPAKKNIPPPPPPSTGQKGSSYTLDEIDEERENEEAATPNSVVFDLGASSPPQTPDALDESDYDQNRFIAKSASAPQVPMANGDVARRQKQGGSQPAALGSWRNPSGKSMKGTPQNQAPTREDIAKSSSRVGSPYYVEDPVSRVQTPFGSSHALTPLHMIDTENPKPSMTSKYAPEIHDGTHYQGMGSYDNALIITSKAPTNYSTSANKIDQPYDNCERPTVADAAELIRVKAQEASNGVYEGSGSVRGTPSSLRRGQPGGNTPVSRRSSPRIAQGSPRGTPTSVRGASASPRGTPASGIESGSATPGSTRGTPVVADDDVDAANNPVSEVPSETASDRNIKTLQDAQAAPSATTHGAQRTRPPMLLTRQVPIPEGSESDDFEDREVETNLPVPPSSRAPAGPNVGGGRGPYFLPAGYGPLGAMSPTPRSAFTSVPPSDMGLRHPRPQRFSPSGERILNLPSGMRPPFGVPGEPRRFSQPVVVYLNPNMQQSDSKITVYDNVQYVWSDQNPHHYQPYTQGDKTYCDV